MNQEHPSDNKRKGSPASNPVFVQSKQLKTRRNSVATTALSPGLLQGGKELTLLFLAVFNQNRNAQISAVDREGNRYTVMSFLGEEYPALHVHRLSNAKVMDKPSQGLDLGPREYTVILRRDMGSTVEHVPWDLPAIDSWMSEDGKKTGDYNPYIPISRVLDEEEKDGADDDEDSDREEREGQTDHKSKPSKAPVCINILALLVDEPSELNDRMHCLSLVDQELVRFDLVVPSIVRAYVQSEGRTVVRELSKQRAHLKPGATWIGLHDIMYRPGSRRIYTTSTSSLVIHKGGEETARRCVQNEDKYVRMEPPVGVTRDGKEFYKDFLKNPRNLVLVKDLYLPRKDDAIYVDGIPCTLVMDGNKPYIQYKCGGCAKWRSKDSTCKQCKLPVDPQGDYNIICKMGLYDRDGKDYMGDFTVFKKAFLDYIETNEAFRGVSHDDTFSLVAMFAASPKVVTMRIANPNQDNEYERDRLSIMITKIRDARD